MSQQVNRPLKIIGLSKEKALPIRQCQKRSCDGIPGKASRNVTHLHEVILNKGWMTSIVCSWTLANYCAAIFKDGNRHSGKSLFLEVSEPKKVVAKI